MQNFHDYRSQAFEQFLAFYKQEIEGKAPQAPIRLEIPDCLLPLFLSPLVPIVLAALLVGLYFLLPQKPHELLCAWSVMLVLGGWLVCHVGVFFHRLETEKQCQEYENFIYEKIAKQLQLSFSSADPKIAAPWMNKELFLAPCITDACKAGFFPSFEVKAGFYQEYKNVTQVIVQVKHGVSQSGFVFSSQLHRPVNGTVILVSDSLAAKMKGAQGALRRIKLEWLAFEEAFDLFSDDEIEARKLLAPDVMAQIYDVYHTINNPSMCFVFQGEDWGCFFDESHFSVPESKEDLKYFFADVYALRYLPELLERKLGD